MSKKVLILHYNDVYNIEPSSSEPVGGAARMATLIKECADQNPLVVFGGDSLSPSVMSNFTDGEQMVPILNALGTHVACLGNHDLDFGVDKFMEYKPQWTFPWLAANIFDKETGKTLCDLDATLIKECNGVKVGFMGLIEDDWIDTLGAVDPEDVSYRDFVETGRELAQKLISDGAELIVAVTHMRRPSDQHLLEQVAEIDIICGGHDHDYSAGYIDPNKNLLIKSGTEFRDLTKIEFTINADGTKTSTFERCPVTNSVAEDPDVKAIVDEYVAKMGDDVNKVVGYTANELDGRFTTVRCEESNLGNYICDVLRRRSKAEICVINSGTLRSDRLHERGPLTRGDLMAILAFVSPTVVLNVTGKQLIEVLENSVSSVEEYEGRFLQVSGLKFTFDTSKPAGSRVIADSVFIEARDASIDLEAVYTVSTGEYIAEGNDGFTVFQSCEVAKDSEVCPVLPPLIYFNFLLLKAFTFFTKEQESEVPAGLKKVVDRIKKYLDQHPEARENWKPPSPIKFEEEFDSWCIAPVVDGRITKISSS